MAAALAQSAGVTGILLERRDQEIVLAIPHTDYRLHLAVDPGDPAVERLELNKRVAGRITAQARRVDVVPSGGRFIDPVYGRPRIIQGRIMAVDPDADAITVQCGCPFVVTLMPPQSAAQLRVGWLVTTSIERGARFEPIAEDGAAGQPGVSARGHETPINPANPIPPGTAVEAPPVAADHPHDPPPPGPIEPPRGIRGQEPPYGETKIDG